MGGGVKIVEWDNFKGFLQKAEDSTLHDLERLRTILEAYDIVDLLMGASALQLCPENAGKIVRLDALTHTIVSLDYQPNKPKVSPHRLSKICNTPPLGKGDIHRQEDPPEQPFTESISFIGGSYIVFPDGVEDATFIIEHLNRAILLGSNKIDNAEFRQRVVDANFALLLLSNQVAKKANLTRNIPPHPLPSQDIFLPKTLSLLKQAVTL